uniref:C-type lectin domain-containing protein n=1 Tax=Romanomermis culicivorax TaxID=13658 RepID=A0A915J113_ROMCU
MSRDGRLTVGEIWADFAQTTTISGLFFIHKAKNGVLKLGAFLFFVALVTMTTIACYGAVETFFERPTIVVKTMHHGALNFPAVTFCATNPFKASESQQCPNGYMVAGGCYIITNLQIAWQAAKDACQSLGARLPIFSNFSDYLSFFLWINKTSPDTQLWIGLYSSANLNWTWIDGCPYQGFYPGFWAADLPLIQIGVMYGRLTKRGVAWSNGQEVRDVICQKFIYSDL